MTPDTYTIILTDRQMMALISALAHYQEVCEDELANGMEVPFRGHRESIKQISAKLFDRINTPEGTFTKDELVTRAQELHEGLVTRAKRPRRR
jgi:hypothetical protein